MTNQTTSTVSTSTLATSSSPASDVAPPPRSALSPPPPPAGGPAEPGNGAVGRSRTWWLAVGSIVAVGALVWSTFQFVELLAHGRRTETTTVAEPIEVVDVGTDNGFVRIVASERETVGITAVISDGLRATSTSQRVDGGRLVVRSSCPSFGGTWCSTDYTIDVPIGTAVRVGTDNGRIRVTGATGDVAATSDNGSVVIDDARAGSVSAASDNGRVELRFSSAPTSVIASSDNGSIEIVLPDTPDGYRVDASSDNGDVDTAVRTDPSGERFIDARSDNGSVTIRYGS